MHYTVYTRIWCMTERLKGQLLFLVILLTIYYWLPFVYHHKLIHGQLSMSKERRCAQEHSHCFKSFDALWTSFVFAVMICTTRRASSILLVNSRFVLCSISRGWCHFTHSSRKVQGHSTNSIVHHFDPFHFIICASNTLNLKNKSKEVLHFGCLPSVWMMKHVCTVTPPNTSSSSVF